MGRHAGSMSKAAGHRPATQAESLREDPRDALFGIPKRQQIVRTLSLTGGGDELCNPTEFFRQFHWSFSAPDNAVMNPFLIQ